MFTLDLFEGIDEEVIRKTMKRIHQNLEQVAIQFCCNKHIRNHFACTDEFLQNRILIENKKFATSFYDDNTKELVKVFTEAMNHNWYLIKDFLRKETVDLIISWDFKKSLGFGYMANTQGVFEDLHMVQVCIKKDENSDHGFIIASAYPTITKDIKPDKSVKWLRNKEAV